MKCGSIEKRCNFSFVQCQDAAETSQSSLDRVERLIRVDSQQKKGIISLSDVSKPEVSDETGALLVYPSFITYKSFSHRPTSIEHAEL